MRGRLYWQCGFPTGVGKPYCKKPNLCTLVFRQGVRLAKLHMMVVPTGHQRGWILVNCEPNLRWPQGLAQTVLCLSHCLFAGAVADDHRHNQVAQRRAALSKGPTCLPDSLG